MKYFLFATVSAFFINFSSANASTLTFDGMDAAFDSSSNTYTESGFTVSGAYGFLNFPGFQPDGFQQLNFYEYAYHTFSISGSGRFNAQSMSVLNGGSGAELISVSDASNWADWTSYGVTSFENLLVQGFRNGDLIASKAFDMYDFASLGNWGTISFGRKFNNVDKLTIGYSYSADQSLFIPLNDTATKFVWCPDPSCSSFSVDNVQVAPVPLAAAIGPFGISIIGAALLGQRRKRTRTII